MGVQVWLGRAEIVGVLFLDRWRMLGQGSLARMGGVAHVRTI